MASQDSNNNDLAYADTLWKSADALRGQVDAAEYKHVVLGLLFLKYISDAFAARREGLMAELEADGITGAQMESLLESRDEYTAERVFWVPPEARWQNLQNQAIRPDIATLIDDAILAVERDNPNLKADYILANPPFNISDWSGKLLEKDVRWRYGTPPAGNANYAWIQHFIHHLAPPPISNGGHGGGVAGFVMANGSLSSGSGGEGEIRQRIVEADLVDAIVALPAQLFLTTGIPACLWFLTRDKTGRNLKHGGPNRKEGRRDETLFIDARKLGTLQTRTLRVLTGGDGGETLLADGLGDPRPASDIGRIVYAFRQWRGEPAPAWWDAVEHGDWTYRDIPGFCKAETIDGIRKHGFVLTPGRYVGAEEQEEDSEPFEEKYPRLLAELEACFVEGERLMGVVRERLKGVGNG
ncbi:MAG: N-6 DNA methylase [Thiocapsa sp.]|uniref:type I restriction-modification system subunit M n=1 Tax=Thiocapsa sp. TaxID=2024551 RepID=UPI001BCFE3BF|nr:class I SAM-dependent DNA methyltransferase [Thiocapsa sp.]QVL48020.1 MAG: N-6 DNA methylase [Thiocapsa sp.]